MHRFFIPPDWIQDDRVTITGNQAHQIKKVLRAKAGDRIVVLDNTGVEYRVNLIDITSRGVSGKIVSYTECQNEPEVKIVLYQSLLKGSKFEMVLQKCTEVGVSAFVPVVSERCVSDLPGESKLARWHQIVLEAAEQSKRCIIPKIFPVMEIENAMKSIDGLSLMPWESESEQGIKSALTRNPNIEQVSVFIGPEGGFSDDEAGLAQSCGVETVSLGKRILRAETAGLVTATSILYESGEIGG